MSTIWQAIVRSFFIGFVIVSAFQAIYAYEFWFLEPGQGYLSSADVATVPDGDKAWVFVRSLAIVPVQLLAVSGLFFLIQAPVVAIQLLLWR